MMNPNNPDLNNANSGASSPDKDLSDKKNADDMTGDASEGNSCVPRKVGKWTAAEDNLLRKYVPFFGEKQWRKISQHIPGRTSIQCLHRWTKILKPGLVKGPWTTEEDQQLIAWVKAEGPTKWAQASNFIKGRSGKQCRERWFNSLCPDVKKGSWTQQEDELIFELYNKYGTSWSKIAKYIPGRTENAVKNRFYSTLRKLAADKRKTKEEFQNFDSLNMTGVDAGETSIPATPMSGDASGVEPPNLLYKLLQDKVYCDRPVEAQEKDQKMGEEPMREQTKTVACKNETSSYVLQEKQQESNVNITKVPPPTQQEQKVTEQPNKEPAVRMTTEMKIEDNDLVFEKFLLSLDQNISEDFVSREIAGCPEVEELPDFDILQQKILNYCQDNIQSLSEAFKNIGNSQFESEKPAPKNSTNHSNGTKTITQVVVPKTFQNIDEIKTDDNGYSFFQKDVKGIKIKITTPKPVTQISSNNNKTTTTTPPVVVTSSVSPVAAAGNKMPNFVNQNETDVNNYFETGYGHGQGFGLMKPVSPKAKTTIRFHESPASTQSSVTNMGHHDGTGDDNEKKMTFLFQQLASLEDLISNTRNELMRLEAALEGKDEKIKRRMPDEDFGNLTKKIKV